MKGMMVSVPHHLKVVLKVLLPSTEFTPKKREHIFDGLSYLMSCVEEVLAIDLLTNLSTFVEKKGYKRIYLRNFEGLNPAKHLYEKNGFKLVEQYKGNQWGTEVNEQRFELRFE